MMRYAEVIGDPIAQSKSPVIHKYWLAQLDLAGDYLRTHVRKNDLSHFLAKRRGSSDWLGCNVTIPHKEQAASLVDWLEPRARAIGAINCIVPDEASLAGYNSDIDGIEAALAGAEIHGRTAVVIGGGGAARAVIVHLASKRAARIRLLVRNRERAETLRQLVPWTALDIGRFDEARTAFDGAATIINATPLGMTGAGAMPGKIIEATRNLSPAATLFDMVTTPVETELLLAGRDAGAHCVDGLTMLVGQAARAFHLFYGCAPPPMDRQLRDMLADSVA